MDQSTSPLGRELSYMLMLVNPTIRIVVNELASRVKWSSVSAGLLDIITSEAPENTVEFTAIKIYLAENDFSEAEIEHTNNIYNQYCDIKNNSTINNLIKTFATYAKKSIINNLLVEYGKDLDSDKFINKVVSSIDNNIGGFVPIQSLANVVPSKVIEEEIGSTDPIKSSFSFINQSLPLGGYTKGQLVLVAAPPSVGKTTFMLTEAMHFSAMGYHVLYVALGDMMNVDFCIRPICYQYNVDSNTAYKYADKFWATDEMKSITKNFDTMVQPASKVSVGDIINSIKFREKIRKYDIIIVDYDRNIANNIDNMYEKGAKVYEELTSITRMESGYKLVLVGSQVKPSYWDWEHIPLEGAAESSMKQATVDIMLTIGKSSSSIYKVGYMSIEKSRRGIVGTNHKVPYRITETGKYEIISETQYMIYRGQKS